MDFAGILALFLVVLLFSAAWFSLSYFFNPQMKRPDGYAKVTGNCGDTMEIGLKIKRGRVVKTHFATNGCTLSGQCVEAAARLAGDLETAAVKKINMTHIIDSLGSIPESHLHCAQLAEITLHRAIDDYFSGVAAVVDEGGTGVPAD